VSTVHAGQPPKIKDSVKHEEKQLGGARKRSFPHSKTAYQFRVSGGPYKGKVKPC
jgi:hypothetical protein